MSAAANEAAQESTARSFTRLTVLSACERRSYAVPDDMSLPELLSSLVRDMGLDTDAIWRLEDPLRGTLSMADTPATLGLLDGATLHLRSDSAGTERALVDDVADSVVDDVERHSTWDSRWARASAAGALSLGGLGISCAAMLVLPSSNRVLLILGVLWFGLVAFALMALARGAVRVVLGLLFGGVWALPLAGALLFEGVSWGWPMRICVGAGFLAGLAMLTALSVRQLRAMAVPVASGAAVVLLTSAGYLAAERAGISSLGIASVGLVCVLLVVGAVPWMVVPSSGLAGLGRSVADGAAVPASEVGRLVSHARLTMLFLFGVLASTGAGCAVKCASSGSYVAAALGVVCLLALIARARRFIFPGHVLALAVPPGGALLLAVPWIAGKAGHTAGAVVAESVVFVLGCGVLSLFGVTEVWKSRARLAADKFETLLLLLVIPLVLGVFDVYARVYHSLR